MFLRQEYLKIARRFVNALSDQVVKLLQRPREVDLHFHPEEIMAELMVKAHREGYEKGRREMLEVLNEFNDTSKDPKEN
jgi:hypothetical protein